MKAGRKSLLTNIIDWAPEDKICGGPHSKNYIKCQIKVSFPLRIILPKLSRINLKLIRSDSMRLDWTVLCWTALGWAGLDWTGLGWAGLGWTGLGWAGLGWAGLGCPDLINHVRSKHNSN